MEKTPKEVEEARALVKRWEGRNGHNTYVHCIDGGWGGFQALCLDCDWEGPEHLRGDEEMDTPESRRHKVEARQDASKHTEETSYEF